VLYKKKGLYCNFQCLLRKGFCFELQTLIKILDIVMSKAKFVIS